MSAFERLVTRFEQELDSLVDKFKIPIPSTEPYNLSCPPAHRHSQAFLLVLLQTLWSDFTKNLLTISVQGGDSTLSGTVLTPISGGSTAEQQVQRAVARVIKTSQFQGEVWHNCAFVSSVATELMTPNQPAITLGLGADFAASNASAVRNFLVHPGNRSRPAYDYVANRYGMGGADPIDLLNLMQLGGITLFELWVSSLKATAYNAAK